MRVGALRNVMDIQQPTDVGRDSLNAPIDSWTTWRAGVFCEKTGRRGAERLDSATSQRYSETSFWFRCHYSDVHGIDATMRILFEGQIYEIHDILPDDQRRSDCLIGTTLQDGVA